MVKAHTEAEHRMTQDNNLLRRTFDHVAQLYDQVRPGYPEELFDDVVVLSELPPHGRILEIGCGTGQATVPFARRGYRIHCVELGARMAAVARRNLAAYPDVEVEVGNFETWPVDSAAFDLVIAATAFHWIDPAVGYRKVAEALKPRGALAIVNSQHVRIAEDLGFFDAVQQVYERETPEIVTGDKLLNPDEMPDGAQPVEATGLFKVVGTRRYLWSVAYDAASYIRVLETYSGHRGLTPDARERLYRGITEMINMQAGGTIRKGYLTTLIVACSRLS